MPASRRNRSASQRDTPPTLEILEDRTLLAADLDFGDAPDSYGTVNPIAGDPADDDSLDPPEFSPDGTRMVFSSFASNLVAQDDPAAEDVFVKDLRDGSVTLVSSAADGTPGNGGSAGPTFSPDGNAVAFEGFADNLVPGDDNGENDIFVKNLVDGTVTLVSSAPDGSPGNDDSYGPTFSPDGTRVLFRSRATNLVAGPDGSFNQLYAKNLLDGSVTLVSAAADGAPADSSSFDPVFSPDGGSVLFSSSGSNLVAGDTNGAEDVFVKNLTSGAVTLVSSTEDGVIGDDDSFGPTFGPTGERVAFNTLSTNLAAGADGTEHLLVKDLGTGEVLLASSAADGTAGNDYSYSPVFGPTGEQLAFLSVATNFVAGTDGFSEHVFVKNLTTGAIALASGAADGTVGDDSSEQPAFGPAGDLIAFLSYAENLGVGGSNFEVDVFVKNLGTGEVLLVSGAADGTPGDSYSEGPIFSPDGGRVAFSSFAENLVAAQTGGGFQVFLKDLGDGSVVLVTSGEPARTSAASHMLDGATILGPTVTAERNGQPSPGADADSGDDGVVATTGFNVGQETTLQVTAGAAGTLGVWLDADRSGTFDADERSEFALAAGSNTIRLAVPADGVVGNTYARFRFATDSADVADPVGVAADGEVEDYRVAVEPTDAAPTVTAIAGSRTGTQADFTVSFSEAVTGVDAGDFSLVTTGGAGGTIASVAGSGDTRVVTVTGLLGAGTLALRLDDDDSVTDTGVRRQPLAGGADGGTDSNTLTFDLQPPTAVATSATRTGTTGEFVFAFSEDVTGVDGSDFRLDATGTATGTVSAVTGSGTTRTVTVSDLAGDGTLAVRLLADDTIADAAGNALAGGVDSGALAFDLAAPTATGVTGTLGGDQATFAVGFDEDVTGVDGSDFRLDATGTAGGTVAAVTGSGSNYTVTVTGIGGTGTIALELLDDDSIADAAGNTLAGGATSPPLNADGDPPTATAIGPTLSGSDASFTVTFDEAVTGVDAGDFRLNATGTATGAIVGVGGSGTAYTVSVAAVVGAGTLTLELLDDDSIADASGNLLAAGLSSAPVTVVIAPAPTGAEIALFDAGRWSYDTDLDGRVDRTLNFGVAGDRPFLGDFNGDFRLDLGVFRNGQWLIDTTADGQADTTFAFGQAGDLPFVADFDGDGNADLGTYGTRGAFSTWSIDHSSRNGLDGAVDFSIAYGIPGDRPFVGDWNNDGRADLGLYRNGLETGGPPFMQFFIDLNRDGGAADTEVWFGTPGDKPFLGDFNGDGTLDPGVFRYNPDLQGGVNQVFFDTARDGGTAEDEVWVSPATGDEDSVEVPTGLSIGFGRDRTGGSGGSGSGSGGSAVRGVRLEAAIDWALAGLSGA